jgi:hypothetical protein
MPPDRSALEQRAFRWAVHKWPGWLIRGGIILFWVTCLDASRLPVEALFLGPALLLAGVLMSELNKRGSV